MKTILLLIPCLFLFACTSSLKESDLVGIWEIYRIEEINKKPKEQVKRYIEFKSDGSMAGGHIGEEPHKFGKWKLDSKTNTLNISSAEENKDDGDYIVERDSQETLILKQDSVSIYFRRMNE
ncbi:MAG: hypothetical protein MI810_24310 [Flavobacteriales bacterium]|jgi:hypothetical protein|nr:hypothetical protein [Flavobacteriales bacterium]